MRTALFWDITQRIVVMHYRRFGTTYRSHHQGSIIVTLEDRTSRLTSGVSNKFCISLTVHLGIILVNNQLDALFSMYLFHFSTCFDQPSAHHQENRIVSIHHLVYHFIIIQYSVSRQVQSPLQNDSST